MVNNCIYCKCQLNDNSVFDVCRTCGFGVWGEKMFNAIVTNMTKAKESGDLYQGSITTPPQKKPDMIPYASQINPKTNNPLPKKENPIPKAEELLSPENELTLAPEIKTPTTFPESSERSW